MSLSTRLQDLAVRAGTEDKALRTLINGNAADLSALSTTAKNNLVAAINEIFAMAGGGGFTQEQIEDFIGAMVTGNTETGITVTYDDAAGKFNFVVSITSAEVTDFNTAVDARVALIVDAAPATLDTLNELAAALGDDPNFATTITNALAGKQPLDTDLSAIAALTSAADKGLHATGAGTWALHDQTAFARTLLDDADAATARGTLAVYSTTEIGDPDHDFVATFEAALV